ncbi:hypothetical protein QUC31_013216 [Theobroma cacao]
MTTEVALESLFSSIEDELFIEYHTQSTTTEVPVLDGEPDLDYYYDESMMTMVPWGYRFVPTDEDLILHYLSNKAKGEALPCQGITDCEIYGDEDKEPWKIFGRTSAEKFYVFIKLKKKDKGKRIERRAGRGTWKGQRTDPVMDSENNPIGFKKLFVFEIKDEDSNNVKRCHGHWLMYEYSLPTETDYVLCAIRNKHATTKPA